MREEIPNNETPFSQSEVKALFRSINALKAIGEDKEAIFVEYHHGTYEDVHVK